MSAKKHFINFLATAFWLAIPVLVYRFVPGYARFESTGINDLLLAGYLGYLLFGFPALLLYARKYPDRGTDGKSVVALRFLMSVPTRAFLKIRDTSQSFFCDEKTRVAFLAIIVKLFYFPIMLVGVLSTGYSIIYFANNPPSLGQVKEIYYLGWSLLIFLDTSIFAFAYLFESKFLNNEIKSVEPTLLGWAAALATYFPFNVAVYEAWAVAIPSLPLPFFYRGYIFGITCAVIALIFWVVYVWASFSLGYKAGNLVNRGVVSRGPYAYIRHPAYVAKNLAWLFALLPVISNGKALAIWGLTLGIYYLRAVTEERHLSRDPEYVHYCNMVPNRFIPGIY